MSTTVQEVLESRSATYSLEKRKREYRRQFRVISTTLVGAAAIISAVTTAIGTIGSSYAISGGESDPFALLTEVSCQQMSDGISSAGYVWTATASYTSDPPVPDKQCDNPLDMPITYQFDFVDEDVSLEEDLNGVKVVNSAGKPFAEGLTVKVARPQITATVNIDYASFNLDFVTSVMNSTNDGTWNGFAIDTVLLRSYKANEKWQNGQHYYEVSYVLAINADGWQPRKLDRGWEYLNGDGKLVRFVDEITKMPTAEPGLLDGSGGKLASGDPAEFLTFAGFPQIDFSSIGL